MTVAFGQSEYGSTITVRLDFDPTGYSTITFRLFSISDKVSPLVEIATPSALLSVASAADGDGKYPISYTLQKGDLDDPGYYIATVHVEYSAPDKGIPIATDIFQVRPIPGTAPW